MGISSGPRSFCLACARSALGRRHTGVVRDEDDGLAPGCRRQNSSMTSWPPFESRAPVGSSASNSVGSFASACAMASRCRAHPDRPGLFPPCRRSPAGRGGHGPGSPPSALPPHDDRRQRDVSKTVMPSRRLQNWKTMPMWRRRSCTERLRVRPVTASTATVIVPSSATSARRSN